MFLIKYLMSMYNHLIIAIFNIYQYKIDSMLFIFLVSLWMRHFFRFVDIKKIPNYTIGVKGTYHHL